VFTVKMSFAADCRRILDEWYRINKARVPDALPREAL